MGGGPLPRILSLSPIAEIRAGFESTPVIEPGADNVSKILAVE
jgi:hypothetical protein